MKDHWSKTDAKCPKCGRDALRTRSGNQLTCSAPAEVCSWSTRTDGPTLEECRTKFEKTMDAPGPEFPRGSVFDSVGGLATSPRIGEPGESAPEVVVRPPTTSTCRHAALRRANGGTCPRGCP